MEGIKWVPSDGDKEWVFYHDGMTEEEFDEEYLYLNDHIEDWHKGRYKPLWKQRQEQK